MKNSVVENRLDQFLKDQNLYKLGDLPTEQGHPLTQNLSHLAINDVPEGIQVLRNVDKLALDQLSTYAAQIFEMKQKILQTFSEGGRIYICGCGATGRLAISLERIWREVNPQKTNQVIGFMAGGDNAFVHAIEGFEDFPEYGAHQLRDLNFSESDLFIGVTEGGETPFVIGATHEAREISLNQPYFLYCNPDEVLKNVAQRSAEVIEDSRIQNICLDVGPMALAGSTRMQASTVLMAAIGICLFGEAQSAKQLAQEIHKLSESYLSFPIEKLEKFVIKEANTYLDGHYSIYKADDFSSTVFTDTTERAPTFSLAPFDNFRYPQKVSSLTYVSIPGTHNSQQAWERLFLRPTRTLSWSADFAKTTKEYSQGFEFSELAREHREHLLGGFNHYMFIVERIKNNLMFSFRNEIETFPLSEDVLTQHLILKMVLNIHSTLLMGRLGRYEGHFMTYVSPSNGKLIDRAARYARKIIYRNNQVEADYEDIVRILLRLQEVIPVNESVVLKTVESYLATSRE